MTARAAALPVTEDTVRSFSAAHQEPRWLTDRRIEALRTYEAMSMPDPREEEWRRTDFSHLDLDGDLGAIGEARVTRAIAGRSDATTDLVEGLPKGVFFGSIHAGLREHEAVIKQHLHSLVLPSDWKLAALEAAMWQEGTFLYVPRGVEVSVPLQYRVEGNGATLFPHLLIVAEAASNVTIIQDLSSPDVDAQSLVSGVVEIIARQDSRVRFIERQRWGANAYSFSTVRARVEQNAEVYAGLIGLGGKLARTRLEAQLVGEGGRAELIGLTLGDGKQHFDYQTLQDHLAPRTSSDLLFKAALDDESSNVWHGTVRIHKGASLAEASQTSRNLLLSDHAMAAPIPVLEIEAYDVLRCSHGATAGPVDQEQLFYLESRGIPPAEAESLLIEAFFQEAVDRIPDEKIREQLMQDITAKIGASS